jgi:hypothetical protein
MIQTGFYIGERDWWIMASLNVAEKDLGDIFNALLACGCSNDEAQKACVVLSRKNSGFTLTNMEEQYTLMFASVATSPEELFDTITHETKHAVEHISSYYDVDPKSEQAAYLQGEISKKLFPAVAIAVCPKCHNKEEEE